MTTIASKALRQSILWLVAIALLTTAPPLSAAGLSLTGTAPALETLPAHQSGQFCYTVESVAERSKGDEFIVFVTLDGPRGEVGGKPGIADGKTPICFTIPPVPGAGSWNGCDPPRKMYTETYVANVKIDSIDHPDAPPLDGFMGWPIERPVTQEDPRPDECKEAGNWNWSFKTGYLNCKKLPMRVNLPGFSETVHIENDGLRMIVTGVKSADRLVSIREADRKLEGKDTPYFYGKQDTSKLFDGQLQREGEYEIYLVANDRLTGRLVVENAPYQGDVCSIVWPFEATAIEDGDS